jgi:hypothetical protein
MSFKEPNQLYRDRLAVTVACMYFEDDRPVDRDVLAQAVKATTSVEDELIIDLDTDNALAVPRESFKREKATIKQISDSYNQWPAKPRATVAYGFRKTRRGRGARMWWLSQQSTDFTVVDGWGTHQIVAQWTSACKPRSVADASGRFLDTAAAAGAFLAFVHAFDGSSGISCTDFQNSPIYPLPPSMDFWSVHWLMPGGDRESRVPCPMWGTYFTPDKIARLGGEQFLAEFEAFTWDDRFPKSRSVRRYPSGGASLLLTDDPRDVTMQGIGGPDSESVRCAVWLYRRVRDAGMLY